MDVCINVWDNKKCTRRVYNIETKLCYKHYEGRLKGVKAADGEQKCSECHRKSYVKGYCTIHYSRMRPRSKDYEIKLSANGNPVHKGSQY